MPAPATTRLSRRGFLGLGAVTGGLLVPGVVPSLGRAWAQTATLPADPFSLGVASGDPAPDGMVLWTRLAPVPLQPDGGMPAAAVDVEWQLAEDDAFTRVVRSGTVRTTPDVAHSVHVELTGLPSDRRFAYRFRAAGFDSPVGRTRTMPAASADKARLRLAVVGCQMWESGFYSAYADLARQDVDLVLHTGDYVYENAGPGLSTPLVRTAVGGETVTLDDYRVRHAMYKTDPDLQAAHAAHPFVVTWDDHEVQNNYAGLKGEGDAGPTPEFTARRTAAYRAYYEHMPLRSTQRPTGPDLRLYRGLEWGTLARLNVLDTRQYRDAQPCGDGLAFCAERLDPARTLMGREQEAWLHSRLRSSPATWNVLSQQIVVASFDYDGAPGQTEQTGIFNLDSWDGYDAERNRLMDVFADPAVSNPVVVTGDVHSSWANDLRQRFFDDAAPLVGSEFVGTSISSVGIPTAVAAQALPDNPHVKYYNGELRGYLLCTVTPQAWTTEYRSVTARTRSEPAFTSVVFATAAGQPGVQLDGVGGSAAPPSGEQPGDQPGERPAEAPGGTAASGVASSARSTASRALPATGPSGAGAVTAALLLGGALVARRYREESPL